MNPKTKNKRQEIKDIKTKQEYISLMDSLKITDEDRHIMDMIFLEGKSYGYIADALGYSIDTIRRRITKVYKCLI